MEQLMGYDMYCKASDADHDLPPRPSDYEGKEDAWNAFWKAQQESGVYFRLNIWGMGNYRDYMTDLGMGHWHEPAAEWPPTPDFITTDDWEDYSLGNEFRNNEVADYFAKLDEHLGYLPEGFDGRRVAPGIALAKFCSNDGWWVRPEEIKSALATYDSLSDSKVALVVPQDDMDYWEKWIEFLRHTVNHDGFTVH